MKVVVLTGPESSGKTRLAAHLQERFGGLRVDEYAREYIKQVQRDTCYADIEPIAREQLRREDLARAEQPPLLLLDTHLLSNLLWSRTLFGQAPVWLEAALGQRQYHLHLLLAADGMPWQADGQRCQPLLAQRQHFEAQCRAWLQAKGLPFSELTGHWAARCQMAEQQVACLLGG